MLLIIYCFCMGGIAAVLKNRVVFWETSLGKCCPQALTLLLGDFRNEFVTLSKSEMRCLNINFDRLQFANGTINRICSTIDNPSNTGPGDCADA